MNRKLTARDICNMALIFTEYLLEEIDKEKMNEVTRRNASEKDPNICHSHDFCDANMLMRATFKDYLQFDAAKALNDEQALAAWDIIWKKAKLYWLERFPPRSIAERTVEVLRKAADEIHRNPYSLDEIMAGLDEFWTHNRQTGF